MDNKRFDELMARASQTDNLTDLFMIWKEAHVNEPCDSFRDNSPVDISKDGNVNNIELLKKNFIYDGITSEKGNECFDGKADVLFLLKEPNASDLIRYGFFDYDADCQQNRFWFNMNSNDKSRERYMSVFSEYLNALDDSVYSRDLFAYVNVNKRGGLGSSDTKRLKAYLEVYKVFLLKEIMIIDPKIIFVCGFFNLLKCAIKDIHPEIGNDNWNKRSDRHIVINGKRIRIVHIPHPAARISRKQRDENVSLVKEILSSDAI